MRTQQLHDIEVHDHLAVVTAAISPEKTLYDLGTPPTLESWYRKNSTITPGRRPRRVSQLFPFQPLFQPP